MESTAQIARDRGVEQLLQGPPRAKTTACRRLGGRDRAMLRFLCGALRVSELINVKIEDLKPIGHGRQGRQAHRPAGRRCLGDRASLSARCAAGARGREVIAASVHRARGEADYPAARVATGECDLGECGASCFAAHAASQLRNSYGRERSRPAHRADYPGPCRYLNHAGVHALGARSAEPRASPASSARQEPNHCCQGGQ